MSRFVHHPLLVAGSFEAPTCASSSASSSSAGVVVSGADEFMRKTASDDALTDMAPSPHDRGALLSALFPEGEAHVDELQRTQNSTMTRDEPTQSKPAKVKKSRRYRYRRKHEVDALRIKVVELAAQLERLRRKEIRSGEDTTEGEEGEGSDDEIWESRAASRREQARIAMIENTHLRAQYETQLQAIKRLDAMYYSHQLIMVCLDDSLFCLLTVHASVWLVMVVSFVRSILDRQAMNASAEKHFRTHPYENDVTIFSSLGADFDTQYAKVDSIMRAAELPTTFDQNMSRDMQLRRSVNGIYFLENVRCKITPRNVVADQGARPRVKRCNELLHEVYEVWEQTDDTNVRKMVDTIHLPHTNANATLTTRTALRKYREATRSVVVWDAVFEITGPVSMRFRERGWQLKHQLHETPFAHVDAEQACVRITPELCGAYSAQDVAVGSLANLLVASYHQHIRRIYNAPERIAPRA